MLDQASLLGGPNGLDALRRVNDGGAGGGVVLSRERLQIRRKNEASRCQPGTSQNGGTCHDHVNAYSCSCSSDWKGANCQEPKAPPCRTINEPRFHGGNLACDWPNVGHTLNAVCRENGYNHVKNWQRNGNRVDCYGWRGHWHHDSNPGYVRQITCCK